MIINAIEVAAPVPWNTQPLLPWAQQLPTSCHDYIRYYTDINWLLDDWETQLKFPYTVDRKIYEYKAALNHFAAQLSTHLPESQRETISRLIQATRDSDKHLSQSRKLVQLDDIDLRIKFSSIQNDGQSWQELLARTVQIGCAWKCAAAQEALDNSKHRALFLVNLKSIDSTTNPKIRLSRNQRVNLNVVMHSHWDFATSRFHYSATKHNDRLSLVAEGGVWLHKNCLTQSNLPIDVLGNELYGLPRTEFAAEALKLWGLDSRNQAQPLSSEEDQAWCEGRWRSFFAQKKLWKAAYINTHAGELKKTCDFLMLWETHLASWSKKINSNLITQEQTTFKHLRSFTIALHLAAQHYSDAPESHRAIYQPTADKFILTRETLLFLQTTYRHMLGDLATQHEEATRTLDKTWNTVLSSRNYMLSGWSENPITLNTNIIPRKQVFEARAELTLLGNLLPYLANSEWHAEETNAFYAYLQTQPFETLPGGKSLLHDYLHATFKQQGTSVQFAYSNSKSGETPTKITHRL